MELKGNKGEWSELYAFLKLLGEGKLYCGDGALNRYDDKCYPILKIFRNDKRLQIILQRVRDSQETPSR